MAKKKIETTLRSWDEVNESLRKMAEIDVGLRDIEGYLTLQKHDLLARADAQAAPLLEARKSLETDIAAFCEERKGEFVKVRSREFTFGKVAFHLGTKLIIKSVKGCLSGLKALKLTDYIRTREELNKEAMLDLDDLTLARVGAVKKPEDKLTIEPFLEKICKGDHSHG